MSDDKAAWVEACKVWTADYVLEKMRALAAAAVEARGEYSLPFRESRAAQVGSVIGGVRGLMFLVQLQERGLLHRNERRIHFESVRPRNEKEASQILVTTFVGRLGKEPEGEETAVGLALDCMTGTPCLVVDDRQTTVEGFVREALLPILFPDFVAVKKMPPGTSNWED